MELFKGAFEYGDERFLGDIIRQIRRTPYCSEVSPHTLVVGIDQSFWIPIGRIERRIAIRSFFGHATRIIP